MGVYHPYPVRCQCGTTFTAHLAEGVNATRSPDARARIVAGVFHRVTCPACGASFTAEKEFVYTDFARGTLIKVKPRHDRHLWREASRALERETGRVPDSFVPHDRRRLRVVFGMAELREKLLAEDAGLDDRKIELLKVLAIADHPVLVNRPRLRLILNAINAAGIEFIAAYDHSDKTFRVTFPRWLAEHILEQQQELEAWAGKHRQSILRAGEASTPKPPLPADAPAPESSTEYWVNMWRWSPQPTALDRLRQYAKTIEDGGTIDLAGKEFKTMLGALPRGAHLPSWAKQDVRTLSSHAKGQGNAKVQDALFEIRFGKTLEDDWALNTELDDIDTLWQLLEDLPDFNVEGNTYFDEIFLAEGKGGGWYQPATRDIYIGASELPDRERFEDVMRHEVGHAVHEQFAPEIDGWLASRFGWTMFGTSQADIDQWVALMGGWPAGITAAQKAEIRGYLDSALGTGSAWVPGLPPNAPSGHPWWGTDFGPRLAYEKTGPSWYKNTNAWHRHGSKAFFLNYWYRALCVVDVATLDVIETMPSMYAAMSPFEFFAELYALYFDADDPLRPNIPPDVVSWLDGHIANRPDVPPMPAAPVAREWDTTTRPNGR